LAATSNCIAMRCAYESSAAEVAVACDRSSLVRACSEPATTPTPRILLSAAVLVLLTASRHRGLGSSPACTRIAAVSFRWSAASPSLRCRSAMIGTDITRALDAVTLSCSPHPGVALGSSSDCASSGRGRSHHLPVCRFMSVPAERTRTVAGPAQADSLAQAYASMNLPMDALGELMPLEESRPPPRAPLEPPPVRAGLQQWRFSHGRFLTLSRVLPTPRTGLSVCMGSGLQPGRPGLPAMAPGLLCDAFSLLCDAFSAPLVPVGIHMAFGLWPIAPANSTDIRAAAIAAAARQVHACPRCNSTNILVESFGDVMCRSCDYYGTVVVAATLEQPLTS